MTRTRAKSLGRRTTTIRYSKPRCRVTTLTRKVPAAAQLSTRVRCICIIFLVYIPKDQQSILEKEIHSLIKSKLFWQDSLMPVLELVNKSISNLKQRGKAAGLEFDEETEKEVLSKCIYESLHKVMSEALKKTIVKEEQSYSKQPLLLAHPSSVKSMKGGRLD